MTPEFQHLAKELKEAREAAGYTIEKLSSLTRIDKKFLQNLEAGNFSFLAEVYVKAFIRTVSKAISLDENVMMKKFNLAKEGKMPEPALPQPDEKSGETTFKSEEEEVVIPRREAEQYRPSAPTTKEISFNDHDTSYQSEKQKPALNPLIMVIAGAVIVVFLAVYYFFIREDSVKIIDETPVEQSVSDKEQPRYEESLPETPAAAIAPGDSLNLSFKANDSTWLKINYDDLIVREFYLRPGMEMVARAKTSFTVLLGNIRGVNISYNGQPVTIEAAGKRVIRIKFDNTGHRVID